MPLAALASASDGAVIIAHGPTCGSASVLWLDTAPADATAAHSTVTVTGAVALPGLDSTTPLVGAAFSADAVAVAAVGDAKTVWLWRLMKGVEGGAAATAVLAAEWRLPKRLSAAAFTPTSLLVADRQGDVFGLPLPPPPPPVATHGGSGGGSGSSGGGGGDDAPSRPYARYVVVSPEDASDSDGDDAAVASAGGGAGAGGGGGTTPTSGTPAAVAATGNGSGGGDGDAPAVVAASRGGGRAAGEVRLGLAPLLAHTSLLTDLVVVASPASHPAAGVPSSDGAAAPLAGTTPPRPREPPLIATADRDGKVRLSSLPYPYVITAFCLGQLEGVTRLAAAPGGGDGSAGSNGGSLPRLVSAGLDGRLVVWGRDGSAIGTACPGGGVGSAIAASAVAAKTPVVALAVGGGVVAAGMYGGGVVLVGLEPQAVEGRAFAAAVNGADGAAATVKAAPRLPTRGTIDVAGVTGVVAIPGGGWLVTAAPAVVLGAAADAADADAANMDATDAALATTAAAAAAAGVVGVYPLDGGAPLDGSAGAVTAALAATGWALDAAWKGKRRRVEAVAGSINPATVAAATAAAAGTAAAAAAVAKGNGNGGGNGGVDRGDGGGS
ncbi:hypothetical protein MMPV_008401 [Pyropia vietnamensis]